MTIWRSYSNALTFVTAAVLSKLLLVQPGKCKETLSCRVSSMQWQRGSSNSVLFIETVVLRQNSRQVFIFYWKIQSNGNKNFPHLWESWKYVWSIVGLELAMRILHIIPSLANPFSNENLRPLSSGSSPWVTWSLGAWPHCLCSLCVLGLFLLLTDYVSSTYMYLYWILLSFMCVLICILLSLMCTIVCIPESR